MIIRYIILEIRNGQMCHAIGYDTWGAFLRVCDRGTFFVTAMLQKFYDMPEHQLPKRRWQCPAWWLLVILMILVWKTDIKAIKSYQSSPKWFQCCLHPQYWQFTVSHKILSRARVCPRLNPSRKIINGFVFRYIIDWPYCQWLVARRVEPEPWSRQK